MAGSPTFPYLVTVGPDYIGKAADDGDKLTYGFASRWWINTAGLIPLITLPGHEGPR